MLNQQHEGSVVLARARLNKAYGRMSSSGAKDIDSEEFDDSTGTTAHHLAKQTEFGYTGYDAPLG